MKKIISEEHVGSKSSDANKKLKEINLINETEKQKNIREAEKLADIKLFERIFNMLNNNLNLAVLISPGKSGSYNQGFNKELFNNYIANSKNKNALLFEFNVDGKTLTEEQEFSYLDSSLKTKDEEYYTSNYSGSVDSYGNVSISRDTATSTEYYIITEQETEKVYRSLCVKFVSVSDLNIVVEMENEYAPYCKLHNNYLIYNKNINKSITKKDCIVSNSFQFISSMLALLFSIYSLATVITSFLRIFNVGKISFNLEVKNFTLSTLFLIPFLFVLLVHSIAFIIYLFYNSKFNYLNRMQKEDKSFGKSLPDETLHFYWDEYDSNKYSCIISLIGCAVNVASIMLSMVDEFSCCIVSGILVIIFLIAAVFEVYSSILKLKNKDFEKWNNFVSNMNNFRSSGKLDQCEHLVNNIKNFTINHIKI